MKRYFEEIIRKDSDQKPILISGPRQCGKTTLAKNLFNQSTYLSYDEARDREAIIEKQWRRDAEAIIFDELHKMKEWKRWLKGLYDTEGNRPRLIVTGSANMETFTKVGDSMAGRYFPFRLHPIDVREAVELGGCTPSEAVNRLLSLGGFPEPFLNGSETFYRRWRRTHLDIILRQDFVDLSAVRNLKSMEVLIELATHRIGSPFSYSSLATDLQLDPKTVKSWLMLLQNFYLMFSITPYHRNIARAILKEPKFYFFDIPRAVDNGAKLENLVACSLLKACHFLEDTEGLKARLHYLRTRDGQELDFLIAIEDEPLICFEIKRSDHSPSKHFDFFESALKVKHKYQLVLNNSREFDTQSGVKVRNLGIFLSTFELSKFIQP
jgi:predicted AAA+ superfamily ATPase